MREAAIYAEPEFLASNTSTLGCIVLLNRPGTTKVHSQMFVFYSTQISTTLNVP